MVARFLKERKLEIALMQQATDVTIAAKRSVHPRVEAGMASADIATC